MGKITSSRGTTSSTNFGAASNNSNCGCSGGNSMFPDKPTRNIKFSSSNGNVSLVVNEGANTVSSLDLCDYSESYEQFFNTSFFISKEKKDVEINYGHLGTQITFLAIYVEYSRVISSTSPEKEIPCLTYTFETEPEIERPINKLFIHTGTENKRIPKVFLSNPSKRWDARVYVLASTEKLTFEEVKQTQIGDDVITIDNLLFNYLNSNSESLCILNSKGETVMFILWENISNIELNGKIITIDDTAMGKINLSFKTEYQVCQAYSLILWGLSDPENNIIPNPPNPDDTAPVITYNSSFTTDILLSDYPVNGTNGDDGYRITKNDILDLFINEVNDNRDGQIFLSESNITLSPVDDTEEIDEIIKLGLYNLVIDVEDNACNKTTDSFILNIKDENPPQIILTNLGLDLLNSGTSGTSGSFNQSQKIYLEDYSSNTITKQNLIDLLIKEVWDERDGNILLHINNISTQITSFGGNTLYEEITQTGKYDIRFQVEDSDGNIGNKFYSDKNTPTGKEVITLEISENQPPEIFFNDISPLFLYNFVDNEITKDYLNNNIIDKVEDDRDGLITTDVLNIQLFQFGEESATSGTNTIFVNDGLSSTSGAYFEIIPDTEILYIDESGLYFVRVRITDSDGDTTTSDKSFTVFD